MKLWADVFPDVSKRVMAAKGSHDPIMNQLKEIMLFTAMSMRGEMLKKLEEKELSDRSYFHLLGMDLLFDSSGNPWVLELNDRPSMIRRPIDNNESQNIDLLREELEIVFGISGPKKWKKLYPGVAEGLEKADRVRDELGRLDRTSDWGRDGCRFT
jgi:hypothetical protein